MPRLIIHGGAGNITPTNLPSAHWAPYKASLLRIYHDTNRSLQNGVSALDAATQAVTLFEDCELFNCGKGAVSDDQRREQPEMTNQADRYYVFVGIHARWNH